jgi:hypothetical protein
MSVSKQWFPGRRLWVTDKQTPLQPHAFCKPHNVVAKRGRLSFFLKIDERFSNKKRMGVVNPFREIVVRNRE